MPKTVLAALLCLLAVNAFGQWSEPVPVPYESTWCNYEFVITPGDTIWALWTSGWMRRDSAVAYASWSVADSWSEPESIDCTDLASCTTAGVDGEGRIWFLRFDGSVPLRKDETSCIVASVRESTGWRNLRRVLHCDGQAVHGAVGLDFAIDKDGLPWLGITEHIHEGTGQYHSARFGRLQGDTCTWPGYVMKGDTEPNSRWVVGPFLEPRPDSGMWSACHVVSGNMDSSGVYVHVVRSDTAFLLHKFGYSLHDAVVDSTGRLWVIYSDTLGRLWSATVGLDSTVESRLVTERLGRPDGVSACVDCEGWVWCTWVAEDSTMAVAWNRGGDWSQPEQAAGGDGYFSRLVSDSRGLVHLYYGWFHGMYGVHRLSRPGVGEAMSGERGTMNSGPTLVRGVLVLGTVGSTQNTGHRAELLDVGGRKALDLHPGANDVSGLSPGVYFVREPSAVSRKPSAVSVRKVVVQR